MSANEAPTLNKDMAMLRLVSNATLLRRELLSRLLDPRRDLNTECGYPEALSIDHYKIMYRREGLARRVVNVLPEECWSVSPEVYEGEKGSDTEFEKAWKRLEEKFHIFNYLERVDMLSGIGRYGVLLLGLDDGKPLNQPVDGIDETGQITAVGKRKLIYLRALGESVCQITKVQQDVKNPRFGYPTEYLINFVDSKDNPLPNATAASLISCNVHWTRIIHVVDNREMSEVLGNPRMEAVFNRLLDVRKVLSGSGEMFWKGAFPGYSFEVNPDQQDAQMDSEKVKAEFEDFSNGLQRYMALTGVTAKSLSPQVADPKGHLEAQMDYIALSFGVPKRVLFGSERGELASSQDSRTWNKRLARRQNNYLTPMVIRPLVDRLLAFGILPPTQEMDEDGAPVYKVDWPDLEGLTDQEKADIGARRTDAFAKYIAGNVEVMIAPEEYLVQVMGMTPEEAKAILKAAEKHMDDLQEEQIRVAGEQAAQTGENGATGDAGSGFPPESGVEAGSEENPPTVTGNAAMSETGNRSPEGTQRPFAVNGGAGSGNFGHSGRRGQVGGSSSEGSAWVYQSTAEGLTREFSSQFGMTLNLQDKHGIESANRAARTLHQLKTKFELPQDGVAQFTVKKSLGKITGEVEGAEGEEVLGAYHPSRRELEVKTADRGAGKLRVGGWTGNVDDSFEGTVRHEVGHTVHDRSLSPVQKAEWRGIYRKELAGEFQSPNGFSISAYAMTNADELFAESFSAYTHGDYKVGMLPKHIESFLGRLSRH